MAFPNLTTAKKQRVYNKTGLLRFEFGSFPLMVIFRVKSTHNSWLSREPQPKPATKSQKETPAPL